MTPDLVQTLSILSAAAAAAALAGLSAPLSCSWPSLDSSVLKRRLSLLGDDLPGGGRRLFGMAALSLLLAGAGALAYAAEPAAPDQLPHEVVGVVGSGGQLSLQVKAAGETASRTLKVGDTYKDGWTLKAVTSSMATLSKGEEVREVGLNPAGAVASAPDSGPPTTVSVTARQASDILAELRQSGQWNGEPRPGLTQAETERYLVNAYRVQALMSDVGNSLAPGEHREIGVDEIRALGVDTEDYAALAAKTKAASPGELAPMLPGSLPGVNVTMIMAYPRPAAP